MPPLQQAIDSIIERRKSAEALIRYSVNSTIQKQLLCLRDPAEMWTMLSNQFNKTYSQMQRSIHASNLYTVRPHPGEKIELFCERLQQYRDPVEGTKEEISDNVMIHYLLNFTGVQFSEATHMPRKELNKETLTLQGTNRMPTHSMWVQPSTATHNVWVRPSTVTHMRVQPSTATHSVWVQPSMATHNVWIQPSMVTHTRVRPSTATDNVWVRQSATHNVWVRPSRATHMRVRPSTATHNVWVRQSATHSA